MFPERGTSFFAAISANGKDGDGEPKTLGSPGAEAYRFSGASADGNVIFGYTGEESYCTSCNGGAGELKVKDARFTLWDRRSGRVVVRSPRLKVVPHTCPWIHIGACEDYDQVPELQMSADGKAVLAFWQSIQYPPAGKGYPDGELNVFRRP